jgi:F-type H+-transporting ATPase subunit b
MMGQMITKVVVAAGLALAAGGAWIDGAWAAEKGGGHKFPPLQADTYASQIFWLAIIFAALYLLMARIALPRVGGILQDRQQHIDGDLAEAKRLKDSSDAAIASYEKELADARGRAQALANETREKYAAEAETARKALDNTLNERIAAAERTIATRRTEAMANVQDIAVTTAAAIVERLTGNAPSNADVAKSVADALKR